MGELKFKDGAIRPGMVIHCPTEEDAKVLLEHLDSLGYIWEDTLDHLTDNTLYDEGDTYFLDYIKGENITFLRVTHDSRDWAIENGYAPTEFSDLIEPDDSPMTAVEVLSWLEKNGNDIDVLQEAFSERCVNYDTIFGLYSAQQVFDYITAYETAKKRAEARGG